MPQLDKITFFSQFFWLSFFYLGFYFLIYKHFLPKMSRTLKLRKRRMNTSQEGVTHMGEESHKVANSYQTLLSTGLSTCKTVFNQNYKGAEDWVNNTVSQANETRLKNTNQRYIKSLGERSVSQRLDISQAFANLSEKSRFSLLVSKLESFGKNKYSTLDLPAQGKEITVNSKVEKTPSKKESVEKEESYSKNKNKPPKNSSNKENKESKKKGGKNK